MVSVATLHAYIYDAVYLCSFFRAVLCLFTRTKCKHRKMLECIIIRLTLIYNHNLWTNWVDDAAAVVGIWINYNWLNILEKCILTQCVIVILEKGNDRHCGPESFAFPLTLSPIISTHLANWKKFIQTHRKYRRLRQSTVTDEMVNAIKQNKIKFGQCCRPI